MATHSSILAWRQRSLVGYSPWGHKKLDMTERLRSLSLCPPHCKMGVAPLSLGLFHLVEARSYFFFLIFFIVVKVT